MTATQMSNDIHLFNTTFDEIGDQFNEVHNNLSYNIERFKAKKEKINSYSTQKIDVSLQMIKRERKLTGYANKLISKQKSLNKKKNYLSLRKNSEMKIIDDEIEKIEIRLQEICKEKKRLINKKQELLNEHNSLINSIQKSTIELESVQINDKEKEFHLNKKAILSKIEENNEIMKSSIDEKQNQIDEIQEKIIFLNSSILQCDITYKNVKVDNQTMKSKIFGAQNLLNKTIVYLYTNKLNESKEETQIRQNSILELTSTLKNEETELIELKNTAQSHCECIKEKINLNKSFIDEVYQNINNTKIEIQLKNNQINEIRANIFELKEQKEEALDNSIIQTNEFKKSTEKLAELTQKHQLIFHEKEEIESQLKNEKKKIKEMEEKLPLLNQYIQLFIKIINESNNECDLNDCFKKINDRKNKKLPSFKKNPDVKKERSLAAKAFESLASAIVLENDNRNNLIDSIKTQKDKQLKYQKIDNAIKNRICEIKNNNNSLFSSFHIQPTVENVSKLIEHFVLKRKKRMEKKRRENALLEKRFNELSNRIDLRKRKMKRQINSIVKEKDEFDILPDEEKLILKSINSLSGIVSKEINNWMNFDVYNVNESIVLNSWEKQIDDLYDKLDEFFLRK